MGPLAKALIIVHLLHLPIVKCLIQLVDYVPTTSVVQQARIDLDLVEIERLMHESNGTCNPSPPYGNEFGECIVAHGFGTVFRMDLAERLYLEGGHSSKYSVLEVDPLPVMVSAGATVSQIRPNDWARRATTSEDSCLSCTSVKVTYPSLWRPCFGGGTSETTVEGAYGVVLPLSAHCLDNATRITIGGVDIGVPLRVTTAFRSFAGLGMEAGSNMAGEPYYEQFKDFYGADYQHQFLIHQLNSSKGAPIEGTGGAFGGGLFARRALAKKIAKYMVIWMQVVHQLETAVSSCDPNCASCQAASLHAWDLAVAFYAGSLSVESSGRLLYAETDIISQDFGTCSTTGNSSTNERIFEQFRIGQNLLQQGNCGEVSPLKTRIVKYMSVPIIQESLKAAHGLSDPDTTDFRRDRLNSAFFAKILKPLLHMCDPSVADTISNLMEAHDSSAAYGSRSPLGATYEEFRAAIESTYSCMGISCDDVGGLIIRTSGGCNAGPHEYVIGAEPCGHGHVQSSSSASSLPIVTIVIVSVSVLVFLMILGAVAFHLGFRRGRRYADLEFSSVHNGQRFQPADKQVGTFTASDQQDANNVSPNQIGTPVNNL